MHILKPVFIFILLVHGLIHLVAVGKAFDIGNNTAFSIDIPKSTGLLWLAATFLFIITAILFLLKKDAWIITASIAILLSEALIIIVGKEARFGTIANLLLILAGITIFISTKK